MTELKHAGVKGMHWGVRRNANRPGGADGVADKSEKRGNFGKRLDSMKRERQWHSVLKEVHNMNTKDINIVKRRIDLENSFKTLSKSKMATKKDKLDYLRRHEISDQELTRKIARIKAKEALHKAVKEASKEQREFGIRVAQIGASLGVNYATKGRLGPKDLFDAYNDPTVKTKQDALDKGLNIATGKTNNPKVKKTLELAKHIKFKTKTKSKS
jgi:hypothetical protein